MDKTFLVFVAIGIGFLYFVTNFVGDIQAEDDKYANEAYAQEHKYDKYVGVDSVGRNVLNLLGVDDATQIAAWNEGKLKDEYLTLFPDFGQMKMFVDEQIKGDVLSTKPNVQLKDVEDKFFSGTMTQDQARQALSSVK